MPGLRPSLLRKNAEEPREVYQGQSYLEQSKSGYLSNVDYRLRRFAAERLESSPPNKPFTAGQRLLDVGCGTGWFLRAAKERGYDVSGFEFSSALARFTEGSVGCSVHDSDLAAIARASTSSRFSM